MNVETAKKTNPYVVKLSLLDKEDTLNGYSQVIILNIIIILYYMIYYLCSHMMYLYFYFQT